MGRTQLAVSGMACDGCERNVEEALESIEGVAGATADHSTETVSIETNAPVAEDTLREAVEGAGYDTGA